ncbi:MAG: DUF302 domain-containing protein [Bacteroidales bacterium]
MKYYFSKTISTSFDEALKRVTEALKTEGFGILTEIRMHEKLKEKLGVDFKKYTILGACNPAFAYKAVQIEDKIGTMLPCNVLVMEQGNNKIEVAIINPVASMQAMLNHDLDEVAQMVSQKLKSVAENL